MPVLSVIVPTFNERNNIAPLIGKLERALEGIDWEAVFVDDDSRDGTADHVRALAQINPRIRCIQRIGRRGLSSAVVEGLLSASAPYLAVMDADLQHDESVLPEMLRKLREEDLDVVVGSRFAGDADVSAGLSRKRQTMSRVANAISRVLIGIDLADPMAGFFMLRREVIDDAAPHLSTAGFKILLDILASSPTSLRVAEVPFHFRQRVHGESKLDSFVLWEYLMLLVDKTIGRYIPSRFVLFALVGTTGLLSHFLALALMRQGLGVAFAASEVVASLVAMTSNFFLNNVLTYRDRRLKGWHAFWGLLSFCAVCSIGAVTGVGVAQVLFDQNEGWMLAGGASALIGVVWNFAVSSTITWSKKPPPRPRKLRPGAPVREGRLAQWFQARRQLVLYFFIGLSAAATDYVIFYSLHTFAGLNPVAATMISISCSTVYAFTLNAFINFKTHDNLHVRFLSYSGVSLVGMTLSAIFLFIFSEKLGFDGNIVKVLTLPPIFLVQYVLNRRFSFRGSLDSFGLAASATKERS